MMSAAAAITSTVHLRVSDLSLTVESCMPNSPSAGPLIRNCRAAIAACQRHVLLPRGSSS